MIRLKSKRWNSPKPPASRPERRSDDQHNASHVAPGQVMRSLSLLMMGGSLTLAVILGFGMMRAGEQFITDLKGLFNTPQPEPEVDVRSVVVQQVRDVSELSTAVFTMEAVVPSRRERTLGNLTVGSTTLLYIAHGEVRAGVDLSQLRPSDVLLEGEQMTITLPPAQILDQKIDLERSQVYDYDRGFLGLGPDSGLELQSLASQAALNKIVAAACQQGILDQAGERAQLVVTQLMATAGQSVTVETSPALGCGLAATPIATPTELAPASPALP